MPPPTLTFDTAALCALQDDRRGRGGLAGTVRTAKEQGVAILVSANVLAEWWRGGERGQRDVLEFLKPSLQIQKVTRPIAMLAGEALKWYGDQKEGRTPARLTFDATVMATAALCARRSHREPRVIYTADADMADLQECELFANLLLKRP
jgi:hypothetical protein